MQDPGVAPASRLLKKGPVCFEDGFVAVSVFDLDLKGAIVEEFGGPFASAIPDVGLDDPPATDQAAMAGAFTRRPPRASATAPDCKRRRRR
jgi:hypothetical protein